MRTGSKARRVLGTACAAGLMVAAMPLAAQPSVFTYQGQLEVSGTQAASYDFQADLFADPCTAEPCPGTPLNPEPLLFPGTVLTEGRFLLSIDPGPLVFTGPERFLQLRVRRTGSASFNTLLPRQKITATPYAQHASDADFAALIAPGSVGATQLAPSAVVTSNIANAAVTADKIDATQVQRRISGSCPAGSAMRAVDQAGTAPTCEAIPGTSGFWATSGNAASSAQFLGTTNDQPLELRSNNVRVARLEATGTTANVLLGSAANVIDAGVIGATIGGGGADDVEVPPNRVTDNFGTVGGGRRNVAGNSAGTTTDQQYATVSGGDRNTASAEYSSVGGGGSNVASGAFSTIVGGASNTTLGFISVVSGGANNCAGGRYSWAGGYRAKVRPRTGTGTDPEGFGCDNVQNAPDDGGDSGTFVWADGQNANLVSTGSNQFLVRASGGIWLGTNSSPSIPAGHFISTSTGAHLTSGGAWTNSSDRDAKTDFAAVDPAEVLASVLALPIQSWRYRAEDAGRRHIGPMAQDFHAAFGLNGDDDTHISTVDADGVALAAIQGLWREVERLQSENAALHARLDALEAARRQP